MQLAHSTAGEAAAATVAERRVLNAGAGSRSARQLHQALRQAGWQETRIDLDDRTEPDVVGSIVDMGDVFDGATFDAVWSSHVLEHLYAHQVRDALGEFRRVLRPDGFALITSPDIEAVAELILKNGLHSLAYTSLAGPITPLDMLFGHSASVAAGRHSMAHRTGFSCASLGELLLEAGFPSVIARRNRFDLWALAFMPEADQDQIRRELADGGFAIFDNTG